MSVVINTNYAATVASNNLAASSRMLQKSLNRLSSGSKIVSPADDAGGLAVAMKLSAAAVRQGATRNNIANAVSFLQTQDGVLGATGKILNRIGELKVLQGDVTKSTSDKANYQAEFAALQAQLTANGAEKFNGVGLFGSTDLGVATTEDGSATTTVSAVDLLGTGGGAVTNFNFTTPGSTITVPFTPSGPGTFTVTSGGIYFGDGGTNSVWMDNVGDTAIYDGAGNWTFSNGYTQTGSFATVGVEGSMNTNFLGAGTFTPTGTSNVGDVASAADLSSLSLGSITSAISDVATYRAQNGASQSRLGFASELLAVNQANLEAATSRITDVDVAQESTALARYNILVQAGTAMLSQANQSAQSALKLLG